MAAGEKPRGRDNEVGYGRPPRESQFRKGESGNPKGRPKGSLNLATVLDKTLREKVVINENGQRQQVTKMEAAVKQLVNKSAAGDLAAIKFLSALIRFGEEGSVEAATAPAVVPESDRRVMQGLLKRLGVSQPTRGQNESANR